MSQLIRYRAFAIAFLGADGSGKSTIINEVIPILSSSYSKNVYYQHLRPNLIPSIANLFGKNEDIETTITQPHGKSQSGLIGSLLRYCYYMIDYVFGYWIKVTFTKYNSNCVWIFDRYYYDYRIDKLRTRVELPDWLLLLGQKLIPEPDLIICLGTQPEVIYARKPELSLIEIERQMKVLKDFCNKHKRAVWVDTGSSIEQSTKEVIYHITKKMDLI